MKATIAVLAGDGIGPEVVAEGVKVLRTVAGRFGHTFELPAALMGGCAIDATGKPLPEETLSLCLASDAVLLGAVGGPKWDDPVAKVRPEQGLLGIRKGLGLFANLRPVRVYPQLVGASTLRPEVLHGVDILVVRELTGGLYFGDKLEGTERAYDTMIYTRPEIERVVRIAAKAAQGRRNKLTSVDKANILASSRLWRHVATDLLKNEYPTLQVEHILVDACAMYLVRRPASFDVIVTENTFGDILTDEAAMLAGSMGMLPSASLGDGTRGLYEPIHGTAPDIAGKFIANPLATILSCAMLLRHSLGLETEAKTVEDAVGAVLAAGMRTVDIAAKSETPVSTVQMGNVVARHIADNTGRLPLLDLKNLKAVLFDLDGTLYNGEMAIPGAIEAVTRLRSRGFKLHFVTNTTSRGRAALAEKLHRLGFPAHDAEIINPTVAAGVYLRERKASAFLLVQPAALPDFAGVRQDQEHPDYVVVGDLGDHWTYSLLNQAFRFLHHGARLIALGMSRYWLAADGLRLDVGPFVNALSFAAGMEPVVLGKPDKEFFRLVLADVGVSPAQALMVGDDITGDVGGAQAAGLAAALVRTGKFSEADLAGPVVPDLMLDSVAELLHVIG